MLIPFKELLPKHNVRPTGIFQVGSSMGQECQTYWDMDIKRMVMIEALPDVFDMMCERTKQFDPYVYRINACIGDEDGKQVLFNVADNEGQSSSILDFDTHTTEHPTVHFVDILPMKTIRLDTLIAKHEIDVTDYDMLVCDLQGAELMALKGLGEELRKFNSLYLEVNTKHLYKDCPLVGEIDAYVEQFGFFGVEEMILPFGWGDKLYTKMIPL